MRNLLRSLRSSGLCGSQIRREFVATILSAEVREIRTIRGQNQIGFNHGLRVFHGWGSEQLRGCKSRHEGHVPNFDRSEARRRFLCVLASWRLGVKHKGAKTQRRGG